MFLKISQTSQENTWVEDFFNKKRLSACKIFKKRLQHKCFHVKFGKLLRTLVSKNICKWRSSVKKLFLKLCNIHRTKVASDKVFCEKGVLGG